MAPPKVNQWMRSGLGGASADQIRDAADALRAAAIEFGQPPDEPRRTSNNPVSTMPSLPASGLATSADAVQRSSSGQPFSGQPAPPASFPASSPPIGGAASSDQRFLFSVRWLGVPSSGVISLQREVMQRAEHMERQEQYIRNKWSDNTEESPHAVRPRAVHPGVEGLALAVQR